MKIEFLYFEGCPNYKPALDNLRQALDETGLIAEIEMVDIADHTQAVDRRCLGSPSIRINGRDLEADSEHSLDYSMCCRRYRYGGEILGYPSKAMISEVLRKLRD